MNANLLRTTWGRRLLFGALYFSEGAPIGYIWWALPTTLRDAGVPVDQITALTGMLVLPWTLKFLWAPLVDTLRGPRWGYRAWIISTQIGMGLALLPLVSVAFSEQMELVLALLLTHAVLAATQDVSIDALCIRATPASERGSVNGWMQVGMLGARGLFGGAALYAEQWVGTAGVIGALIGCVWLSTVLVAFFAREPAAAPARNARANAALQFVQHLAAVLRRPVTWIALLFAAAGGAGFEAVGATAGTMLIDRGVSAAAVGAFYAVPVVVCMAGGALAGGWLSDRLGRRRSVMAAGIIMAACILLLAGAVQAVPGETLLIRGVLAVIYVMVGVFTAATYALFMDVTDPALGATQFSAYMGATNLCEAWAAYAVGRLVVNADYPAAHATMALVALPALALVIWMRSPTRPDAAAGTD